MNTMLYEPTTETPKVVLDKKNAIFTISGNSLPEDVGEFYNPILTWLDGYIQEPNPRTEINLQFDYYNTSSSKMILKILERFRELHRKGYEVMVSWYYHEDDEDMIEAGEDYAEHLNIPFNFIPIQQ